MLDACQFIVEDTAGVNLETYLADRRLRQSVERSFEIIGESARRLEKTDPDVAERITNIRQIVRFRNVLAHDYDEIRHPRVWEIVQEFLPQLMIEAQEIYRSL